MKALLLNGSPHTEGGVHVTMLRYLEEGLRKAGAEVERRDLYRLEINPCLGCFSCWSRTPGECVQDDDMRPLLAEVARSDLLVLATPVYVDGMTGPMKTFLDRLIPPPEGPVRGKGGPLPAPPARGRQGGEARPGIRFRVHRDGQLRPPRRPRRGGVQESREGVRWGDPAAIRLVLQPAPGEGALCRYRPRINQVRRDQPGGYREYPRRPFGGDQP